MPFHYSRNSLAAIACVLAALFAGVPQARANMTVSPMLLSVAGEKNSPGEIRVTSQASETQYVKVGIKRLVNPATDQEREEDVTSWSGRDVVVSPMKFILPAGASRAVRVISMSAPAQDEAYRVYFESVAGDEEGLSASSDQINAQVSINVVWGVLVRAGAASSQPQMQRVNNNIRNTGNTRLGLMSATHCNPGTDDKACNWHTIEQSIYPGSALALPAELANKPIRIKFKTDGKPTFQVRDLPADL